MEVVWHQTVMQDFDLISLKVHSQDINKSPEIVAILEYIFSVVPPSKYMIVSKIYEAPRFSGH